MANVVIKVKISAIPETGKANKGVIDSLSDNLRLKKDGIHIIFISIKLLGKNKNGLIIYRKI